MNISEPNQTALVLVKRKAEIAQRKLEKQFPTKPENWSKLPFRYVDNTIHSICKPIPYFCAAWRDSLEVMIDPSDSQAEPMIAALNAAGIIVAWEKVTFRPMRPEEKSIIVSSDPEARI